jgi:NAD(P)H-flavin reductase
VRQNLPPGETAVYLCGNPDMIADCKRMLGERNYGEIYTEEYW